MPAVVYLSFFAFLIGVGITHRWLGGILLIASSVTAILVIVAIKSLCNVVQGNKTIRRKMIEEKERNRFLAIVSALIAKIAKADGVVATSEIHTSEACFKRFGVIGSPEKDFCINVFRLAKDDALSAFDYADLLVETTKNSSTRELVYEILWDMAAADGVLTPEEDEMLKRLSDRLQLSVGLYAHFKAVKFKKRNEQRRNEYGYYQNQGTRRSNLPNEIRAAYEVLGCEETDSIDDLKRKYRRLAMRYHPDHLRQDGVPEYIIKKMDERMAEINSAWERVCKYKGIR